MTRTRTHRAFRRQHGYRRHRRRVLRTVLLLLIFATVFYLFRSARTEDQSLSNESRSESQEVFQSSVSEDDATIQEPVLESPEVEREEKELLLPKEVNLDVPFTPQAPYANWSLPYQEACEEASALMVYYFFQKKDLNLSLADREIRDLVDFQEKTYGFYKDSTAEETARFMRDRWGYKNIRVEEASVPKIKEALSQGWPVIVPAAGRQLGNPNFTPPGPLYHMVVIRGYTSDGRFITNDPGTRKGEGFMYDEEVLLKAVHDWNGGEVETGQKIMIVVEAPK